MTLHQTWFIVVLIFPIATTASSQGMGAGHREDMVAIHALLGENKKIQRKVRDLVDGVETTTESRDKKVVKLIQAHAFSMQSRVKKGYPIRTWDPLFAEIFSNHTKIDMRVTATAFGVKVIETSKDPYAIRLIQWHAQAVNGFVKEGTAGMHREHPAPPKTESKSGAEFKGKGDGVKTCPVTGEPVDPKFKAIINGKTVFFCCQGCIETVKRNPKAYLKG